PLDRNLNPERLKRQNAQEVETIREAMSSKMGKSTREPDIPHRNFIPTQLEPVPPTTPPLTLAQIQQQLKAALVSRPAPGSPPPKVAP
ncbi:MAG TPA: hypothetical protein VNZ22_16285, partial [Bacillota bacterium]|nr:hypothetical protein [Bacillota bacterium]